MYRITWIIAAITCMATDGHAHTAIVWFAGATLAASAARDGSESTADSENSARDRTPPHSHFASSYRITYSSANLREWRFAGREVLDPAPKPKALSTEPAAVDGSVSAEHAFSRHLMAAALRRDAEAARDLLVEHAARRRLLGMPKELSFAEVNQVLSLDYARPDLHLRALEMAAASWRESGRLMCAEVAWQECELLRTYSRTPQLV